MQDHPNAQRATEALDAFGKRDIDTLLTYLDPGIAWRIAGSSAISGSFTGHEGVRAWFGKIQEAAKGSTEFQLLNVLAGDQNVMMFMHYTGQRDDQPPLAVNTANALTVGPDGKFTEFWNLSADQGAYDRFWS